MYRRLSGPIRVDVSRANEIAADAVRKLLMPCQIGGTHRAARSESMVSDMVVRDPQSDEARTIKVEIAVDQISDPRNLTSGKFRRGLEWRHSVRQYRRGDERIKVMLQPGHCATPAHWQHRISSVIAHEAAHASDPFLLNRPPRERVKKKLRRCDYYQQPVEFRARLAQVGADMAALVRNSRIQTPIELLNASPAFRQTSGCWDTLQRRQFLKLAADIWQRNHE